jgi:DNA-binding transcriptional LysR family regulator
MLPSLTALKAVEATERAAAQELHVVHGAVSQQIRGLEEMLGQSQRVSPTHSRRRCPS